MSSSASNPVIDYNNIVYDGTNVDSSIIQENVSYNRINTRTPTRHSNKSNSSSYNVTQQSPVVSSVYNTKTVDKPTKTRIIKKSTSKQLDSEPCSQIFLKKSDVLIIGVTLFVTANRKNFQKKITPIITKFNDPIKKIILYVVFLYIGSRNKLCLGICLVWLFFIFENGVTQESTDDKVEYDTYFQEPPQIHYDQQAPQEQTQDYSSSNDSEIQY
jgi:hypothetical protein